jgi:hypothetical protein
MEKVQITFRNGNVEIYPGDNWGFYLARKGISMLDVVSVYRV